MLISPDDGLLLGGLKRCCGIGGESVVLVQVDAGTHEVSAQLLDVDGGAVGDTATGTLTIAQAATVTNLRLAESGTAALGLTGTAAGEHGTTPTGAVEIIDDDELLDTVELDNAGAFAWEAPTSPTETTVHVRYLGDVNHESSDATITVPGVEDSSDPGVPSAPGEPTEGPVPAASDVDLASTGSTTGFATWAALGASVIGLALFIVRRRRA